MGIFVDGQVQTLRQAVEEAEHEAAMLRARLLDANQVSDERLNELRDLRAQLEVPSESRIALLSLAGLAGLAGLALRRQVLDESPSS